MAVLMVAPLPPAASAAAAAAAAVVLPGGRGSLDVDAVNASSRKSHTVGHRVESYVLCRNDGVRRESVVFAASTFWGCRFPSHRPNDRRCRQFGLSRLYKKAHWKHQSVSLGTPVFAFLDPELYTVLELASDAELVDLSKILYGKSLLSPLLKSFTPGDGSIRDHDGQPPKNHSDRDALMARLEARFLFLAADAKAVLSGHRPSYRSVLLQVRKKLQIPCAADLSTEDIESEIFLHLLQQYSRKSSAPPKASRKLLKPSSVGGKKKHVGLPSIMNLRGKQLLSTILKGGGAVTVSTLQRLVSKQLSGKLLVETARYQLAKEAVVKTGQMAAMLENRVAILAAQRGLVGAAKRYITVRSAMSILGPMLWGTLLADMLISAVGTDYARVVRAIYAFAQIRLVRAYSWNDTKQVL